MSDLSVVEFQIKDARRAIDRDFGRLANKGLSSDQRKAILEDLKFNFDALRDLKHRLHAAQFPVMPSREH
jgi:hypothetical protein